MLWNKAIVIIILEILFAYILGRVMIPYFRKVKTGKFELYIGDRFKKDGSEPLFGGVLIAVSLIFGMVLFLGISSGIGDKKQYIILTGFSLVLMLVGVIEDYFKDIKRSILGLKRSYKLIFEYIISLGFLLTLNIFGLESTDVLLPFRLGFLNFGVFYYPITAFFMVVIINSVKVHHYFGNDTKTSVDGLCAVSGFIYLLFFSVYGNILKNEMLSIFSLLWAAGLMGFLIWGISPSKINLGESGALLLGGLISGLAVISGLHLVIFFAGIGFLIDGLCACIGYAFYVKSKKLIFKGSSLHSHFKAKDYNDYKIMLIFSIIEIVGGTVGILFVNYSMKLV